MANNIQPPNYDGLPKTVGEMTPKQLFNLVRVAIQYEAQFSSTREGAGWMGAIPTGIAELFSSPEDKTPNRDTVYAQTGNRMYSVLLENGLIDGDEAEGPELGTDELGPDEDNAGEGPEQPEQ